MANTSAKQTVPKGGPVVPRDYGGARTQCSIRAAIHGPKGAAKRRYSAACSSCGTTPRLTPFICATTSEICGTFQAPRPVASAVA